MFVPSSSRIADVLAWSLDVSKFLGFRVEIRIGFLMIPCLHYRDGSAGLSLLGWFCFQPIPYAGILSSFLLGLPPTLFEHMGYMAIRLGLCLGTGFAHQPIIQFSKFHTSLNPYLLTDSESLTFGVRSLRIEECLLMSSPPDIPRRGRFPSTPIFSNSREK